MSPEEAREKLASHWLMMSEQSLASARAEWQAERFHFAVNRAYYACFYAASAVLLWSGRKFTRHAGVRDAVHSDLVRTGRIATDVGRAYDGLFAARQEADYQPLRQVTQEEAARFVQQADDVIKEMKRLMPEQRHD